MKTMLTILALLLVPTMAMAGEGDPCTLDADCGDGFSCVMEPCNTCIPGEECPPCDPAGVCVQSYEDFPGDCDSDADCPDGLTCVTEEAPCPAIACACPDCAPDDPDCDSECICDEDPCEPESYGYCTYVPEECETDADCMGGFTCQEEEVCSGGGSTGCACPACVCETCPEGEECPPCECEPCECDEEPVEFEEECEVVGKYCAPEEIECTDDSVCPTDWECVTWETSTSCMCADCACPPCQEGEACECDCPPCDCPEEPETEVGGMCVPSIWADYAQEMADYEGDISSYMTAGDDEKDTGASVDVNTEDPTTPDPTDNSDGEIDDQTGDGATGDGATDDGGSGGCSAGTTGTPLSFLVLGILALVLVPRRRREQG